MTNATRSEFTASLFVILVALAAILCIGPGCSSTEPPPADPLAALSGVWTSTQDDSQIDLRVDGQFFTDSGIAGTWSAGAETITFNPTGSQDAPEPYRLLDADTLSIDARGTWVEYRRGPR